MALINHFFFFFFLLGREKKKKKKMKLAIFLSCMLVVSGSLKGTTTASYKNGIWDCTSVEPTGNDTCVPLGVNQKGSLFRLSFIKSGCPSDSASHTTCPGGDMSTDVKFGKCPPIDKAPWIRNLIVPNGTAQFLSPIVTTSGCITDFSIEDSFGGIIEFTLYSVSSSFTSELSEITCPGISDASLRDVIKCTAIASHNSELTSFDEIDKIKFTPASGGMVSSSSYPRIAGQNVLFEFDYKISAYPSSSLAMNYTMFYISQGGIKNYPPMLVTLDTSSHSLPDIKPSSDSLLQCDYSSDNSTVGDETKFTHSCNVSMNDAIGPVSYRLSVFDISVSTMNQHVPCQSSFTSPQLLADGVFTFDVVREGLCLGNIPTFVQIQIDNQNITAVDDKGIKSHNGIVLWDQGGPLPLTPAPPTVTPPTASPTTVPRTITPFTNSPPSNPPESSGGISKTVGIILGILAVVIGIALIIAITCCLVRHRQSKNAGTFSVLASNSINQSGRSSSLKGSSWHQANPPGFHDDEGPSTQLLLQDFSKTDDGDAIAINDCTDYQDVTGDARNSNRSSLIDVAE